ncbi:MAG: hypothetical protein Q8P56_02380 [Candidatus Uhrbacteria bacterium]|nr:hypothetical protein [Candidatus Uhrbacteria bacterium]
MRTKFLSFLIGASIVFSPLTSTMIVSADTLPLVIIAPNTLAPDSDFTATASGFSPNSVITISVNGQTVGVDLYFDTIREKTGTDGSASFQGHVPPTDTGAMNFDFTDEKGITAKGTYVVTGLAPRKFLFAGQVAVTDTDIQVGIVGVGWDAEKQKTVKGFDPNDTPYDPEIVDICAQGQCTQRADELKIALLLQKTAQPGIHTLRVSQVGDPQELEIRVTVPETAENKNKKEREGEIFLIDPAAATADTPSIAVRGSDWGSYDERGTTRAWLVDRETNEMFELTVDRNYRDCMISITKDNLAGGCSESIKKDELFLRLEIPEDLKLFLQPKTYIIYVRTENNIHGGAPFTLLEKPNFTKAKGAALAISPTEGPYYTYAVLFGSGFPRGEGLTVRLDGIRLKVSGYLAPNPDGTFDNVGITIPRSLTKPDGKIQSIAPGKHTIEVSNDNPQNMARASATFIITDKDQTDADKKKQELEEKKKRDEALKEEARLKKERELADKEQARVEKERIDLEKKLKEKQEQEQKQKDKIKKEQLRKQEEDLAKKLADKKKQEEQKENKIDTIKKKQGDLADTFCDLNLPLTFQPGCIQKTKLAVKSKYEGLPCDADIAITLQPGCVSQKPLEQLSLFAGKPCSTSLPITFQPGCVSRVVITPTKSEYAGRPCGSDLPIVFQPGCVSAPKTEAVKPFAGKPCDPILPRVWQEGCIDPSIKTGTAPTGKQYCVPNIPTYNQSGCEPQPTTTGYSSSNAQSSQNTTTATVKIIGSKKCDPTIPHYSQAGCVE